MILPAQYSLIIALAVIGMLCMGSWANLFRLDEEWRFELFYFDFVIGVVLMSLVLGLTFGNLGFDGFTFFDDILHAGRRQEFYALSGGVLLNLGNMLMLAAITVSGFALAFPTAIGLATAIALIVRYAVNPEGNPVLLFTGVGILLAAVLLNLFAYNSYSHQQLMDLIKAGKTKDTRRQTSQKPVILSVIGGVLMGVAFPILQLASFRDIGNELGLGPYALGFLVAVGMFLSAVIFNLLLMNIPIAGDAIELLDYFRGTVKRHALGVLAGLVWCGGLVAGLTGMIGPAASKVPTNMVFSVWQGSMLLGAIWGLALWREYSDANGRVKSFIWVSLALIAIALTLVTVGAPVTAPDLT